MHATALAYLVAYLSLSVDTLLPIALVVLGILFVIVGIRGLRTVRFWRRHWLRYPGEAVDSVWETDDGKSYQYWILQWIGADGVRRTARNPSGSSGGTLRSFPFPVEVMVNPDNPREGQVAQGGNSGLTGYALFTAVGGLFTIVGIIVGVASFG